MKIGKLDTTARTWGGYKLRRWTVLTLPLLLIRLLGLLIVSLGSAICFIGMVLVWGWSEAVDEFKDR